MQTQQIPFIFVSENHTHARGWVCKCKTKDAMNLANAMIHRQDIPIEAFLPAIYDVEDRGVIYPENMPNTKFLRTCYMLPNLLDELRHCCFNNANLSACVRTNNPMIHVISKAWPVRCSIRNFSDIVSNYIKKETYVRECLTEMLYCTFSGRYPHCARQHDDITFRCEYILYRYFVHMKPNADVLSQWIRNDHQHIVFVCIKEYIVFLVDNVPGLTHVLHNMHPWNDFVKSVAEQANFMRAQMRENVRNNNPIFSNIQAGITCMKSFRCKLNAVNLKTKLMLNLKDMPMQADCLHVYNSPLRIRLYEIVKAANIRDLDDACKVLKLNQLLEPSSFDYKFARRELTYALDFASNESFVCLPRHIVKQQRRALCRHKRQTSVFICICCKQIRSFVVNENTASRNAWARGNSKVLIDDCTNHLYCGKKIEKSNNMLPPKEDIAESKKSRIYWKTQGNLMCKYSRLLEVPLMGRMYVLFGTSYLLCPSCLCVMQYTSDRVQGDTVLCIHCQYMSSKTSMSGLCFHCYEQCSQTLGIALENKTRTVCKSCYRPWMDNDGIVGSLTVEIAHRAINERWKTNRINEEIRTPS